MFNRWWNQTTQRMRVSLPSLSQLWPVRPGSEKMSHSSSSAQVFPLWQRLGISFPPSSTSRCSPSDPSQEQLSGSLLDSPPRESGASEIRTLVGPKPRILSLPVLCSVRYSSTTPAAPSPKAKANALIDALPGSSIVTKTGWITLTTAVSAAAISQELFVLNVGFVYDMGQGALKFRPEPFIGRSCHPWILRRVHGIH